MCLARRGVLHATMCMWYARADGTNLPRPRACVVVGPFLEPCGRVGERMMVDAIRATDRPQYTQMRSSLFASADGFELT